MLMPWYVSLCLDTWFFGRWVRSWGRRVVRCWIGGSSVFGLVLGQALLVGSWAVECCGTDVGCDDVGLEVALCGA